MSNLFGGSLSITDAFSNTFSRFSSSLNNANNSFNRFTTAVGQNERANRVATQNMRQQITQLAQTYVQQGYTMEQAIRRATSEISRWAPTSGSAWVRAFGAIRQGGIDAFSNIGNRMQSFSNSTLGLISKLTAGFLSVSGAIGTVKKAFESASELQNAGVLMNLSYDDPKVAKQKMRETTKYADETPWSETEVAGALARMKMMNVDDSQKSLSMVSDIGSIAKIKKVGDITTAVDAYADMFTGEWKRMQTILGIKREGLETFGKENGMKAFSNKKGEVVDKEALKETFTKYLDAKGILGATEAFGKTISGRMSTLFGNLGTSLAGLVGVTKEGEVKSGSLFEKFGQGMEKFIVKINEFANSPNFEKFSTELGKMGSALLAGFSYLLDNPELITDLLKLGIGIFALGKIGGVISSISSVVGLFSSGGLLAGVGTLLAPIAPEIFAVVGSLMALASIVKPDGYLHQSISWLLGKIPFIGEFLQTSFEEGSTIIYDFFNGIWDWIKTQFGFGVEDKASTDTTTKVDNNWYGKGGKIVGKMDDDLQYKTVSDLQKNGTITKSSANKTVNNKTEVNLHVDTVKETADIDDVMNQVTNKLDKHAETRNNLE